MDWLWVVAVSGWLVSLIALATARGVNRRLAQLTEQYWQLKYEHGELKARVRALAPTAEDMETARPTLQQTFVPLSSVKRSS